MHGVVEAGACTEIHRIILSVSQQGLGTLELAEFKDHTFGVLRDGRALETRRWAAREVERSVTAFLKTRRVLTQQI